MKYIVTETELYAPDYHHEEEFDNWEEAHKRMLELYHNLAFSTNPDAIEKAFLYKNSALVVINDGNEVEWKITMEL